MTLSNPVVDERGRPMFICGICGVALTPDDFYALELRLPDHGESADDYFDAELLDSIEHAACVRARRTAS